MLKNIVHYDCELRRFLFDESLDSLASLQFLPDIVMPNGGALFCGVLHAADYADEYVTPDLLANLRGVSLVLTLVE